MQKYTPYKHWSLYIYCTLFFMCVLCTCALTSIFHISTMPTGPKCQYYQAAVLVKFASVSISVGAVLKSRSSEQSQLSVHIDKAAFKAWKECIWDVKAEQISCYLLWARPPLSFKVRDKKKRKEQIVWAFSAAEWTASLSCWKDMLIVSLSKLNLET